MRDPKPVIIVGLCVMMAIMMAIFSNVTGSTNERRTNMSAKSILTKVSSIHGAAYGSCIRDGGSPDKCDVVADKAVKNAGYVFDKENGEWKEGRSAIPVKAKLGVK